MIGLVTVPCSACGREHIVLGGAQYLKRRYSITCKSCRLRMTSELNFGTYLILIIYTQVVVLLTGAPFVLALAGGYWLIAAAAAFGFFLLTVPPAAVLHARSLRASIQSPASSI